MMSYQSCFTQQLVAMYQVANSHVEIRRAATPVGYLGKRIHS